MITDERRAEVAEIMADIPEEWRLRWCAADLCACNGCVQTGNKEVIASHILGYRPWGDPERISELKLMEHQDAYRKYKVTKEEWEDWASRLA